MVIVEIHPRQPHDIEYCSKYCHTEINVDHCCVIINMVKDACCSACISGSMVLDLPCVHLHSEILLAYLHMQAPPIFGAVSKVRSTHTLGLLEQFLTQEPRILQGLPTSPLIRMAYEPLSPSLTLRPSPGTNVPQVGRPVQGDVRIRMVQTVDSKVQGHVQEGWTEAQSNHHKGSMGTISGPSFTGH